jgi:wobble nucleotide-excising tRNase
MDLYTKTNDIKYLDQAYDLTLNNVNFLVNEQKKLTSTYLADVQEVAIPDDATKDEKNQIKDYNKTLKNNRKTELPSIYEPLLLNCELLFALLEKVDVSALRSY